MRGVPSKIGLLLDMSVSDLEKVIYFAGYVVTKINEDARLSALDEIESEYKQKAKAVAGEELARLKEVKDITAGELRGLAAHKVLSEVEYHRMSRKFGEVFEASIGAEAIRAILAGMNLAVKKDELEAGLAGQTPAARQKTKSPVEVS